MSKPEVQKHTKMEAAKVVEEVHEEVHDEVDEEIKIPDYEAQYHILMGIGSDLIDTIGSFSIRIFGTTTSYKKKLELEADAPGKRQFCNMQTAVRKLLKHVEKLYKQQKPKVKKEGAVNGRTGFNRLVRVAAPMAAFLKLPDWDLMSDVDTTMGVSTHGLITREVSTYVIINELYNAKDTATWSADKTLLDLFANYWVSEGVDPKAVKYTDVQKLIKHFMFKIEASSHEMRKEAEYRLKLDDTGEYGGATKQVLDLRKDLVALSDLIVKRNKILVSCRETRPTQGITKDYEALLRSDVETYKRLSGELRAKCDNYGFKMSATYPCVPGTCLGI